MRFPFTHAEFLDFFAAYNAALWPVAVAQVVLDGIARAHGTTQDCLCRLVRTPVHHGPRDAACSLADDLGEAVAFEFQQPALGDESPVCKIVRVQRNRHDRLLGRSGGNRLSECG